MDAAHRKIELQSPSDLTYLTTLLRTAARQKLDLHLPSVPSASEPDDLRAHVEARVDAFVAQIIAGMRGNISINGMEVEVEQRDEEGGDAAMYGVEGAVEKEEFEVFDEKLRGQVGSAIARRDALIGKISAHRRNTPVGAAGAWQARFERESESLLGEIEQAARGDGDVVGLEGLEREEEVRRNWERAVEGLGRLNGGLGETRARLERAGEVVGYLDGKEGRA